jgi:aspartyl-tRNA(Asn)/glutamyl-tRNA(Gln) amidotransferase subunit B
MQSDAKHATANLIRGWEVVIGLEVHAQVASRAKLFSGASTEFGGAPNAHVSLVDAAMPGMLPVINEACVAQAVRTGLKLGGTINPVSVFDRKNYFYPDLPQGYQISQYKQPIVSGGKVEIVVDGNTRIVGIERLHLEQDAGKSIHDQHPQYSYVDLNRSGVALMEIVSKPDLSSAKEAQAYVSKLRSILLHLGTCDGDMEKGNLRADVNVSVRRLGGDLGTRCEIKNVNSIRFIGQAIEAEARRQIDILEDGGKIEQETRLFDSAKGVTRSMRSKEEAHDYRYFPDPDLLPLELTKEYINNLRKDLREGPDEKQKRFMSDYKLSAYDADVLVAEPESAEFFEAVAKGRDGKTAANWVINELFGRLNKESLEVSASPVSAKQLGAILDLIASNAISGKIAKDVFEVVWTEGGDPAEIVEKRGLKQVTDFDAIDKAVKEVIEGNKDKFRQLSIKPALLGWFVGQVMKTTGGKANPQVVNESLKDHSAELVPSATASIFDETAIAGFRDKWRRKSDNAEFDSWDDAKLLEEAGLTVDGLPTFAGLILLGTASAVTKHLANAEVIFEYRNSQGSDSYQDRKEFRCGFFMWVDEVWKLVNLRNDQQAFGLGFARYPIYTFDESSVREAILNAVAHRDYREEGSIWVKQYPRHLQVESPGGFPIGITPDNVLVRQKPRNRRLSEALAKCGLVERSGQGMDRMVRGSILQGKLPPDLSGSDAHHVVLRLNGEVVDENFVRFLESLSDQQRSELSLEDVLIIDSVHRALPLPKGLEARLQHVVSQRLVERIARGKLVLPRKLYEPPSKKDGVLKEKKRASEPQRILQHLKRAGAKGAALHELLQVVPGHSRDQVRGLLAKLRGEDKVHSKGERRGSRWFAGAAPRSSHANRGKTHKKPKKST